MKRFIYTVMVLSFFCSYQVHGQGKWLKKAKQKLEKKGDKAIDDLLNGKKKDKDQGGSSGNTGGVNGGVSGNTNGGFGNGTGSPGERSNTPPPINQSINDAQNALSAKDYSDTRFAIQQALWGIEYQLGKDLLKTMPTSLSGASSDESKDVINSTGFGFAGLNISRTYQGGDLFAQASVVNGAVYDSYSLVLSNPGLYNSSDSDYKVTRINGFKAVIEYTGKGYKIAIPFGQSSVFLLDTSGFANEEAATGAAGEFDIAAFKKVLGEQ